MLKIVRKVSKNLDNDVCNNWEMFVEYCEYLYTLLDISSDVFVEVRRRKYMWDECPVATCSLRREGNYITYYIHKRSSLLGMFIAIAHEFVHAEQNDTGFVGDREANAEERSLEIAAVWISGKVRPKQPFRITQYELLLARNFLI